MVYGLSRIYSVLGHRQAMFSNDAYLRCGDDPMLPQVNDALEWLHKKTIILPSCRLMVATI